MRQLGGNDNELSCRLWLLGYELLVVPEVEAGHLFRSAAPYEAKWAAVVHNRLRMAFSHFGEERVERVVSALREYRAFPAGLRMLLTGADVFARRKALFASRIHNDDYFFDKFDMEC
jgi:GT2 family glycosyltransferase